MVRLQRNLRFDYDQRYACVGTPSMRAKVLNRHEDPHAQSARHRCQCNYPQQLCTRGDGRMQSPAVSSPLCGVAVVQLVRLLRVVRHRHSVPRQVAAAPFSESISYCLRRNVTQGPANGGDECPRLQQVRLVASCALVQTDSGAHLQRPRVPHRLRDGAHRCASLLCAPGP